MGVEEIDARLNQLSEAWGMGRWWVIGCELVEAKAAAEIVQELGLARQTLHNVVAAYNRGGAAAIETPGKGQRQRAYLSLQREQAGVDKFIKHSAKGEVSRGLQVRPALGKAVGHKVAKTPLYRVLKRQQWRKVAPHPYHPQSSPEEQGAFKKTSLTKFGPSPRVVIRTMAARW